MDSSTPAPDIAIRMVKVEAPLPMRVSVARVGGQDSPAFAGDVDGHRFRYMLANLETARRERDKALRAAAAWQTIIVDGLAR